MMVKTLEKNKHQEWDDFVKKSDNGTFFHLSGWIKALEDTFNVKSRYFYLEKNNEILGICPLFLLKDLINGARIVSIPVGVYGGILANNEEVFKELHEKSIEFANKEKARLIEYRFLIPGYSKNLKGFIKKPTHATFIKELPSDKEECLTQIPRKARADIRKSLKKGLKLVEKDEFLKDCYDIYAINQRNLGSPVFHYKWMEKLKETFKEKCVIHLVFLGKKPIASVLSFIFKDQIIPFYGASLKQYTKYHPDGFMYLALQEWAVDRGIKKFDFGRSKIESGAYHFKENQGFEPKTLNYVIYPMDRKVKVSNKPSKLLISASNIWKKLPIKVTNSLGPILYPYVIP